MRSNVAKNEDTDRPIKTRRVGAIAFAAVVVAFGVGFCSIAPVTPAGASGTTGTTVSAESSPYGQVLMVGSGTYVGYSLYEFNRDQAHHIACKTTIVAAVKLSCARPPADQTAGWPVLETQGKPVAGPGVDRRLLSSIYRTNLGARQVTYAGHPLYLFDMAPHQFSGELFLETVLPVPPWHGIWYLVSPRNGLPVVGAASLTTQTLPSGQNVLAAVMLPASGSVAITVYSFSKDTKRHSSCTSSCALVWPPLLTTGSPQVTTGLPGRDLGAIVQSDGTHQVTFRGKPLYLYSNEQPCPDVQGNPLTPANTGNGNGVKGPRGFGGHFSVVTPRAQARTLESSG
jgi:predicted lipoprotein with Yx(FWY)xxD motif